LEVFEIEEAFDVVVSAVGAFCVCAVLGDADAEIAGDADVKISRTAAEDVHVEAVFAGGPAGIVGPPAESRFLASLGMTIPKKNCQRKAKAKEAKAKAKAKAKALG
jgi:hypothetical protein